MIDCCSAPNLMPLAQAKEKLLDTISSIEETELVKLDDADGRVLACNVNSPINVPAHNNSAMDGYAFYFETAVADAQTSFECVGRAMAGAPFEGNLEAGQCIRIMTGAVVPDSASSVEMQENVKAEDSSIVLQYPLKQGNHIRQAGEDISADERVFEKGHTLNAVDIGLLASLGVAEVSVYRKAKVAIFSTGDELKSPGQTLAHGDIYESNSQVIKAMLSRMNIDVLDLGIIPDTPEEIEAAFNHANEHADAVISSGGVSVGEADYTKEVLDKLGNIEFWKVAMKPGKPFAFGLLTNSIFFGLPGNPVSATVTFHQLAVPALRKLSGADTTENLQFNAVTTSKVKKRAGRMDFQRGIATVDATGVLTVAPLGHQGSGVLSSLSKANCYLVLPQEHEGCEAGKTVKIELFDALLA